MFFKEDLIIIRHGRSKHNSGSTKELDSGLTKWGLKQSVNVGKFLAETFDGLPNYSWYTSPFLRCLQTVEEIRRGMEVKGERLDDRNPVKVDPAICEYMNHYEQSVVVYDRSDVYSQFDWGTFTTFQFDAEFNEILLHRLHEFYHDMALKSVVVTHGLPAFVLRHIATNMSLDSVPVWDYSIDNASMTWIRRGRVMWHGRNLFHEMDQCPDDHVYTKMLKEKESE